MCTRGNRGMRLRSGNRHVVLPGPRAFRPRWDIKHVKYYSQRYSANNSIERLQWPFS